MKVFSILDLNTEEFRPLTFEKNNIKSWKLSVQVNIGIWTFRDFNKTSKYPGVRDIWSGFPIFIPWTSYIYLFIGRGIGRGIAYIEFFYYSDRVVQFRWNIFCLCCFSMWNTYKYLWRQLIMKSNICSDYHIAFSFLSTFLHILIACSIFHVFLEYIPYPVFLEIEN